MTDPYQVLGIQRGASDDEIKKAYRTMCKRYHPDLNPGDPTAEEKFKQVQEAYDYIMKGPTQQQAAYGYGQYNSYGSQSYGSQQSAYDDPFGFNEFFGGNFYGGYNSQQQTGYQGTDTPQMQAARNYIANRRYAEARNVLDNIGTRNARWYYYSALANQGLGRTVDAMNDARRAYQMEPNNLEYRNLYSRMQAPGAGYQQRSQSYGGAVGMNNFCLRLLLLNLLCNCFGNGCCRGFYFLPGFYM